MTGDFRQVTETFWVAPQIGPEDVRLAAEQGFKGIVNNRPDGEAPGQPQGAEIAAAATEAGLRYDFIPVRGWPGPEQVQEMRQTVEEADGPVLAYCAGGIRSLLVWALGEIASGARTRDEVVRLGRSAGYDLSRAI
jgi:uncharacterized protein (TIGR01244 family)